MSDSPKPAPYSRTEQRLHTLSPWCQECDCIDEAAELCGVNGFVETAASAVQLEEGGIVFLEPPSKRFREHGGCPYYQGLLNSGSPCTVLCSAVPQQLHSYVATKFCEGGRKIYCPIYREKQKEEPK